MRNNSTIIPNHPHPSWSALLASPSLSSALSAISEEMDPGTYYPAPERVMRFMERDLGGISCVIVGMEPYASDYVDASGETVPQATGRSFEVASIREDDDWSRPFRQSSLQNILKSIVLARTGEKMGLSEIREALASGVLSLPSPSRLFDGLEDQGVLFLNASLTVERGKPGSHQGMWEAPMREIISYIEDRAHPVWMLWGRDAQERVEGIIGERDGVRIERARHPRLAAFVDEDPFSRVDEIDWGCGEI